MLGPAHFETLPHVNSCAPTPLHSDRIERPGIKRLRKILAKHESRFSEEEKSSQLSPAKWAHFHVSGEHVAGEGIARIVHSPRNSGVSPAQIGINLIVRGCEVELSVSPEHVVRKKHPVRGRSRSALSGRSFLCR